MTDLHTCSHSCDRPACIKAQRDELLEKWCRETGAATKLAMTVLGREAYDNAPCQAHPLELVECHVAELKRENEQLRKVLSELYALVEGECPALLNEDSGGSARLDMMITEALRGCSCRRVEEDHEIHSMTTNTEVEALAAAMIRCGMATGHGESVAELAAEMERQADETWQRFRTMGELLDEWLTLSDDLFAGNPITRKLLTELKDKTREVFE